MGILYPALAEVGLVSLYHASHDTHLFLISRFIRMFAYGSTGLILALYFSALGHSDAKIGLFMSLTLVGDVAISLLLTLFADGLGRRRILMLGAGLMVGSGMCFALGSNYWLLLAAAVVGVVSPSGNEIGPFKAIEESTLSHLTTTDIRSDIFAWYIVSGTSGIACGTLASGWSVEKLKNEAGWDDARTYRSIFWMYTLLGCIKFGLTMLLSERCEVQHMSKKAVESEELEAMLANGDEEESEEQREQRIKKAKHQQQVKSIAEKKGRLARISKQSRITLLRLCMLFAVDSLASGLVPFSLVSYFLESKFHTPEGYLGTIMSIAWFISALSNVFASSISKRIGLVKTMVTTHLPSAIFLLLTPLPPTLAPTILLIFLRSSLSSMDQGPRTVFLSTVVLPSERTAVMGIVNTVKTSAQSVGPLVTGVLAGRGVGLGGFGGAFLVAGVLKGSYDLGMLVMFLGAKPREEDGEGAERGVREQARQP
ncbi:MAG: para-aminobenzoate synthase, (PABA) [Pycnora praestabilis]|nr:MAG: para-aminobenzoate synthase, (PABA) [Pycnora praestabilis]